MKRRSLIVLLFITTILTACEEPEVYMFSYFQGNGQDGLHLAYSEDGLQWTALNDNASILTPVVGESKLMRDPCIIRGGDGKFHMVWTAGWTEEGIGYASSDDLVNWSEQKYIPVMAHEPEAENTWAPELYYDEASETYMIYWATTIPGQFPETYFDGQNDFNHRMYYVTTKNFETFSETKLLYDHGFNVIDATIHKIGNEYVMFLKDETKYPEAEKNIRISRSEYLTHSYSEPTEPITDNWVEGPTAIETSAGWVVYFDRYTRHEFGAVRSTDLENWTDITEEISFPEGTRHGTVFKITESEFQELLNKLTP